MPIRIAMKVDDLRHRITGLGRYTFQLIAGLNAALEVDELLLINNSFNKGMQHRPLLPDLTNPRVHYKNIFLSKKVIRGLQARFSLPRLEHLAGRFDVYHVTHQDEFPLTRAKKVVTIHDLAHLVGPFHDPRYMDVLNEYFPRIADQAHAIIADSEATRRDVIDKLGQPENKVFTVRLAGSPEFRPCEDPAARDAVLRDAGIDRPYLLYLGTLEPRKNIAGLIHAYEAFRSGRTDAPLLVLAGGKGWLYDGIFEAADTSRFRNDIRFTGYLPGPALPALMQGAMCLVYPSLYEGFGLPVLEAMQCGTPVITSAISSLPEVAGDAALLVDPHDTDALAHALARVTDEDTLRADMARKGLAQAAQFSWERCARETLDVYRIAAES